MNPFNFIYFGAITMKKQIKEELGNNWHNYRLTRRNGENCNLTLGELYREWGIEYDEMMYLQDLNDALYEEGYTPIGDVIIIQL